MKKSWFCNKTVILTGASSGFGKLLTKKLIQNFGCTVIGIARTQSKLLLLQQELGEKFLFISMDASVKDNWNSVLDFLVHNNIQPDILINNAGILPPFSKFTMDDEMFDKVMDVNFYAQVYAIGALLPVIKKSACASIINVASSAALASLAGTSAYSASKSALKSFTEVIALENPQMYVSVICPGASNTDIFRSQTKQSTPKEIRVMNRIFSSPDKLTDKMLKRIAKHKRRIVVGYDANLMDVFARRFPVFTINTIRKFLKNADVSLLEDVYKD